MTASVNPSREVLLNNVAAIHESKETWHGGKATERGYGVYRDAIERVKKIYCRESALLNGGMGHSWTLPL